MPKSPSSVQINVTVNERDKAITDAIAKRAAALGPRWSLSAYTVEILRYWYAQGCPPVSPQDEAMIIAGKMNFPATNSNKLPAQNERTLNHQK